jgi:hypothetical protein
MNHIFGARVVLNPQRVSLLEFDGIIANSVASLLFTRCGLRQTAVRFMGRTANWEAQGNDVNLEKAPTSNIQALEKIPESKQQRGKNAPFKSQSRISLAATAVMQAMCCRCGQPRSGLWLHFAADAEQMSCGVNEHAAAGDGGCAVGLFAEGISREDFKFVGS